MAARLLGEALAGAGAGPPKAAGVLPENRVNRVSDWNFRRRQGGGEGGVGEVSGNRDAEHSLTAGTTWTFALRSDQGSLRWRSPECGSTSAAWRNDSGAGAGPPQRQETYPVRKPSETEWGVQISFAGGAAGGGGCSRLEVNPVIRGRAFVEREVHSDGGDQMAGIGITDPTVIQIWKLL